MTWPALGKASGSGGGGSTTVPGGSTTQLQYNNLGAFAGAAGLTYDNAANILTVAGSQGFSSGVGAAADAFLVRPAANQLALRNGASAQSFAVSNNFTSSSVYEQFAIKWAANICSIGTEALGSGVQRGLQLNSSYLTVNADSVAFQKANGNFSFQITLTGNGRYMFQDTTAGSGLMQFGGQTTAYPALKRGGAALQVRAADDSAFGPIVASTVQTGIDYTVATLPAVGTRGRRAHVTDALAPAFLGVLVGGGAVVCPAFDNGTAWVAG